MEIYRLDSNHNDWAGLYALHGEWDRFEPLDGTPMAPGWEPVEVTWDTLAGRRGFGDFFSVSTAPVFTGRAVEALGDLLERRGELLPLEVVGGGEAYAYNVTHLSDALDCERSEFEYYDDGRRVMAIDDYVFDPGKLAGETIFKLAIQPRGYRYVTDRFRERVEQAGLTGFRWRPPVWTGG